METKILELLSEHFGIPVSEINPSLELRQDLVATDLEIADFFQIVENTFGVTISGQDAQDIHTVEDLVSYITDHAEEPN